MTSDIFAATKVNPVDVSFCTKLAEKLACEAV
jgi:hypothetical protein